MDIEPNQMSPARRPPARPRLATPPATRPPPETPTRLTRRRRPPATRLTRRPVTRLTPRLQLHPRTSPAHPPAVGRTPGRPRVIRRPGRRPSAPAIIRSVQFQDSIFYLLSLPAAHEAAAAPGSIHASGRLGLGHASLRWTEEMRARGRARYG